MTFRRVLVWEFRLDKKMRFRKLAALGLLLFFAGFFPAGQGTAETAASVISQKTCPVMPNRKIKQKFYVDYEGRRIYFCCGSCVKSFKKNPSRYLENL